ncbi:MAG TPA: hypothetical protein VFE60_15225 [Roseiarcus sp.]|nr:hypothetical protein [Roseiarcus sp.]
MLAIFVHQHSARHKQVARKAAGQVTLVGGQSPFARDASLAAQSSVERFLNEAGVHQFFEGAMGGIPGQIAFARGIATGICYAAIVGTVVAKGNLDIDRPRSG